jgi:cystathionine beta-lyase
LEPVDGPDGWRFDLPRLADQLAATRCRTLLLVNPQNPTGRVFSRAELTGLAELVVERDLMVICDEVHADLSYPPHQHIPLASLAPEVAARTVTITSATKAFNLAGIRCALAHIGPERLRTALDAQPNDLFGSLNVLGVEATLAAWRDGDEWLDAVRAHLRANRDLLTGLLARRLPLIRFRPPQATYLAWLDCRELGLAVEPTKFFQDRARVRLSPGPAFGPGGDGFVRLNFATSAAILTEIVERMASAVEDAL